MSRIPEVDSNPPCEVDCALTNEQKREIVQRVLSSNTFASSPALRAFLLYITDHALSAAPKRVKEHQIGTDVLGRKPDYDPSTDNIVRVRAHELRQRLEKYFNGEGAHEPVIVSVRKGSYVPDFHLRSPILEKSPGLPAKPFLPPRSRPQYWRLVSTLGLVASAIALAFFAYQHKQAVGPHNPPEIAAIRDFWGPFFQPADRPLVVIAADSGFALWQDLTERDLNLGDYLGRKYLLMDGADPKLKELAARRCTSPADLSITLRLQELSRELGGRINAQYARNVNVRELRKANAVLIGSRRSNPWVELFEPRMNFVLGRDHKSGGPVFENRHPKPGEALLFGIPGRLDVEGTEQRELLSYAVIALVPNSPDGGSAVLVEGLNMEATEAAGETVTNAERLGALLRGMGHKAGTPVPPFEALLRVTSVPGGYAMSQVVSFRCLTN
ncbi:MAG: hypothetical protein JO061_15735 [Acidobacteriaceae bacterium]|nr:hypothetical protein [Acidobacteriaceae bacterium]